MENKIWYSIFNTKDYSHITGLVWIQPHTLCSLENTIQTSIDSFNNNVKWDDMWTIDIAKERLNDGQDLFIGLDNEGPLAHVWFNKDYLYNAYVDPRRPNNYGVSFIQACLNFIEYDKVYLYCDVWNKKAQKFFEKVGFSTKSS